ncbi:hypothetical protein IWX65_000145 [Arthrobacter sp. CAN_A214]|uniref:hypothetical protein n=1 Tax=Arthrobacter sp. CAN_A214 TaxID=2787720 RepID=UPI0018CB34BB
MEMTGTDQSSSESFGHRSPKGSTALPGNSPAAETATAHERPATKPPGTRPTLPAFNVRYGRVALALAGILGLLGAVITFPFAAFGVVSAAWPVLLGVLAVSAIALLRILAVRNRHARVNRAFAEAMWPEPARNTTYETIAAGPPRELPRVGRKPDVALFDGEQPTPPAPSAPPETEPSLAGPIHPDTGTGSPRDRHEEEPLRNGPEAGPERNSGTFAGMRSSTWQPIDVPRPTYVDAAKAERSAPVPLELPDAPKPTGRTSFKESAAALAPGKPSSTADEPANPSPVGKINLDDILQRRRA